MRLTAVAPAGQDAPVSLHREHVAVDARAAAAPVGFWAEALRGVQAPAPDRDPGEDAGA